MHSMTVLFVSQPLIHFRKFLPSLLKISCKHAMKL